MQKYHTSYIRNSLLDGKFSIRLQDYIFIMWMGSYICQLFGLCGIHFHVVFLQMFTDDHSYVNSLSRANKKGAKFFYLFNPIFAGHTVDHRQNCAFLCFRDSPFMRLVAQKFLQNYCKDLLEIGGRRMGL